MDAVDAEAIHILPPQEESVYCETDLEAISEIIALIIRRVLQSENQVGPESTN